MGPKRSWMEQAIWPWWMAAVWWQQQLQWTVHGLGHSRPSPERTQAQRGEAPFPLLCDDGIGCCTEQGGGWLQGEGYGSSQARGPCTWDPTFCDGCTQSRGQDPEGYGGEGAYLGPMAQVPGRAPSILRPRKGQLQAGSHAQPGGTGPTTGCAKNGLPGPQGRLRQPGGDDDQARAGVAGGSCGRMGTPAADMRRRGRRHDRGDGREIGSEPQGPPCENGAQNTRQAAGSYMREQHTSAADGTPQTQPATIPRRVHGDGDWACQKEEGSTSAGRDREGRPLLALTEQQTAYYAIATPQIDLQNEGNVTSADQAQRQAPDAQPKARVGFGAEIGKQKEGCFGGNKRRDGTSSEQRRGGGCHAPERPYRPDEDRGRSDRVILWRRPRPDDRACTPARGKFPVARLLYGVQGEDEFMNGGLHYQGLSWFVPMLPPMCLSAEQSRHGPSGGHVRGADYRRPRDGPQEDRLGTSVSFDILDYCEAMYSALQYWWWMHAVYLQICSCGLMFTFVSIASLELWWLLLYASPKPRRLRRTCQMRPTRFNVWKVIVALAVLPSTYAGPPMRPFYKAAPPPRPSDLELWAAGQMTLPEQMAAAMQRYVLESPVQHNRGVAEPPNLTVVPPDLVGEPVIPTMEERAIHVTLWVAAVHYESETLDLQLPAPLSLVGMKEALRGACNIVPDALDEFHPTVPQLGDYFGSFVAQPVWLRNTNRTTLILDARSLGGTAYPYYQQGRVNLQTVSRQLPEFHPDEVDYYVFGRLTPLVGGQNIVAIPGGVVKAVPHGRLKTGCSTL